MTRQPLVTERLPLGRGPFSTAILGTASMWISGQVGLSPGTASLAGESAGEQLTQIFANLDLILSEAGKSRDDILKVTLYLTDMADYAEVNDVYTSQLSSPFPARTAIAVAALPIGARVEADVIVG